MESRECYCYIENFREQNCEGIFVSRILESCYRKTICKTNDRPFVKQMIILIFQVLDIGNEIGELRFGNRLGYWGTGAGSNLNSDRHRINTSIRIKRDKLMR